MNRDRDAAAVVLNADPAILGDGYKNVGAVAGERFIDGVVDDFVNEVVKTTGTGGADVHARTLANSFEPFEDLDIACVVVVFRCGHIKLVLLFSRVRPTEPRPLGATYIRGC